MTARKKKTQKRRKSRVRPTIGERLEAVRAEIERRQEEQGVPPAKRLTKTKLASIADVDPTAPYHWAAGRCDPMDIESIARGLKISVAEIIAGRLNDGGDR